MQLWYGKTFITNVYIVFPVEYDDIVNFFYFDMHQGKNRKIENPRNSDLAYIGAVHIEQCRAQADFFMRCSPYIVENVLKISRQQNDAVAVKLAKNCQFSKNSILNIFVIFIVGSQPV